MSINEIMQRVSRGGRDGVRKTELKKEFQNASFEEAIELMIRNGDIVMDRKGTSYYLWKTENYLGFLLTTDPKFRLLYNKIEETKILVAKNTTRKDSAVITDASYGMIQAPLDKDTFKQEFDFALRKHSSSTGWVPLTRIREEMETKYNLGREEFYSQVEEITNKEYDSYELSSGGVEGIMVRGILHGFVRCI